MMKLYLAFVLLLATELAAFIVDSGIGNNLETIFLKSSVSGGNDIGIIANKTSNGLVIKAFDVNTKKQFLTGTIGVGRNFIDTTCFTNKQCRLGDVTFSIDAVPDGIQFVWESNNTSETFTDCYDLVDGVKWFGGPERRVQTWPIEKMVISQSSAYVSRKDDNFGVAERYWLNSAGAYIYLKERNPLFVSQNEENTKDQLCFISKLKGPYINRTRNLLDYLWVYRQDAKEAHMDAIINYLGKPTGHPDSRMVTEPIWTTWAQYKRDIRDETVLEFAQSIRSHGYKKGQVEIDDNWEKCYGAQEFAQDKFSNIANVVKQVKDLDFRVTLWIHPFVNKDCQNNAQEGDAKDYFVRGADGLNNATWWNGDKIAHQIDFTKPEAAEWWSNRIRKLQLDPQIDSFKFDGGESDYAQQPSVYPHVDQELIPNILTSSYLRTCAKFGNLIEVRAAWRTQDLPIFVRMLDKDTSWGWDDGLPTLVTTLLQLNMNGYPMVLPDMIGGNGYSGEVPTPELMVRWTQANTFMPAMQFSYLPWEVTNSEFDAPGIIKRYVDLHEKHADIIIAAMKRSVETGSPVNPPIWWIDPTDPIALACDDEFLVGEEILVAPILEENQRSRTVYLPKGKWRDGQNGTVYQGPITLDYAADIDILPYFFHESS